MNVIQSAGGPLIGLDRDVARWWSANTGKSFIGEASRFTDDYDALGYLPDGTLIPPWSIALFHGSTNEALLISMPYETAIIGSELNSVYMAQVEFAEPEWCFSRVTMRDFDETTFGEEVRFHSGNATYLFFDSALLPSEVGDNSLQFTLSEGDYVFSAGFRQPDEQTSLLLYRILRAS